MIAQASKTVNACFPELLQIEKATGHTGRRSFVSASINSGVDATGVSLASKHKRNAVRRYIHPEDHVILATALAIVSKFSTKYLQENEEEEDSDEFVSKIMRK